MNLLEEQAIAAVSIKNVLFATDFSATSEAALPYAVAISRRYGSLLHVAHVIPQSYLMVMSGGLDPASFKSVYDGARSDAEEKMQSLMGRVEDVPHRTYLAHGNVWDGLSNLIRTQAIDLLVLGTHGRGGVEKLLMGSIAEKIFRQAYCPVLTVGPRVFGRSKLPLVPNWGNDLAPLELDLQEIVYATDFSPESLVAVPYTVSLVREFQARLAILYVVEESAGRKDISDFLDATLQRLMKIIPDTAGLWHAPEPVLEFGTPGEGILKAAAERNADLIVLGARPPAGHLTVATHLPWRTAHQVVAEATCPVLSVRGRV